MNLPLDFLQMMRKQIGEDEAKLLENALQSSSPISIRLNKIKTCDDTTDTALSLINARVPWCDDGYYLSERPSFTFDPLFHAGVYYVQEASSMFLSHIIRSYINHPVVALDMCAAPGGKSTLAQSALPEGSLLVANEVIKQRSQVLAENIIKWGNPNVIVTSNYAEDFAALGPMFDLVICDAPCSGEGMFRKDEGAIVDWSMSNVEVCWRRQRDILANVWQCLKPGGILIYSTCTFNRFEDEDIVGWIVSELGGEILQTNDLPEWNITNGHFFPHKTKGEGFFVCPFRKTVGDNDIPSVNHNNKKRDKASFVITSIKAQTPIAKELNTFISEAERFCIYENKGSYYAFPLEHMEILRRFLGRLSIIHSGVKLATIKGKMLQPDHALAMSTELLPTAFHCVELTKDEAIAYLRTEAISVDAPKGYVLLTYKHVPLGFGKNIGNRVNNLYPAEWKIRKNY